MTLVCSLQQKLTKAVQSRAGIARRGLNVLFFVKTINFTKNKKHLRAAHFVSTCHIFKKTGGFEIIHIDNNFINKEQ